MDPIRMLNKASAEIPDIKFKSFEQKIVETWVLLFAQISLQQSTFSDLLFLDVPHYFTPENTLYAYGSS
jgi:hypothetical protein